MINLHESMGSCQDETRDPWICSQTRICSQTLYRLRYTARSTWNEFHHGSHLDYQIESDCLKQFWISMLPWCLPFTFSFWRCYFKYPAGQWGSHLGFWNVTILAIDSFHIVSAHAPNCLVLRYLREITHEGAAFIWLPYITLWNMENY